MNKIFEGHILPNDIILNDIERKQLNHKIAETLKLYFKLDKISASKLTTEEDFEGKKVIPEVIFKAINNRTILKNIVSKFKIKSKESLLHFIDDNLFELFSYNGKYFNDVYKILLFTSNMGNLFEIQSFDVFKMAIKQTKNIDIEITKPTIRQDIDGIDGIFLYNNNEFTIQVKPFFKIEEHPSDNTKYLVFCDGVLKDLVTHYLIAHSSTITYIFRSKGIVAKINYFVIPKDNLVFIK